MSSPVPPVVVFLLPPGNNHRRHRDRSPCHSHRHYPASIGATTATGNGFCAGPILAPKVDAGTASITSAHVTLSARKAVPGSRGTFTIHAEFHCGSIAGARKPKLAKRMESASSYRQRCSGCSDSLLHPLPHPLIHLLQKRH